MNARERLYHVTVLSNFARGFDKYSHGYSKAHIPESTYPDRFYLLRRDELHIGVQKASGLLAKLNIAGNRLIVLETEVDGSQLHPNTASGRGQFIDAPQIELTQAYDIDDEQKEAVLREASVEELMAASLRLSAERFHPFMAMRPRTVSFLPVASACQAKCAFCFSKASISSDQAHARLDWQKISAWLDRALAHGAERAVITGGGEPTLLPPAQLDQLVAACASRFDKVVLITNGHALAKLSEAAQIARLDALYGAGLRVLALSRHHHEAAGNERLMGLDIPLEALIRICGEHRSRWPQLRLRLICVLQQGGIADEQAVEDYVSWATSQGVEEICFKELYVSTSTESMYYDRTANEWSRSHQIPLSLVTRFAEQRKLALESVLPWGAPVYRGEWQGRPLRIAAYTEPSLFWERTQGVARSWNVMADGRCHVSLEDRASELLAEDQE
jgi:pyruvate-formate lyase-activating enzyme